MTLTPEQLTGRDASHLVQVVDAVYLQAECAAAFAELRGQALKEGFDLRIASGFRSFERQLAIWNAKATGERPVYTDAGEVLANSAVSATELVHYILRYSALPGASRHHWGTDMDVYDAAAVAADYQLQLSPAEVADGGVFGPLHRWLDTRIAQDKAGGFYRPYAMDRGGVAPERWHLSYAPLARGCEASLDVAILRQVLQDQPLQLKKWVLSDLPVIYTRYCC
jgi:LAS superfamily LD-carboxypeptidase LdcB